MATLQVRVEDSLKNDAISMTSGIGKTAEKLKPFLNGAEIVDAKRVKSAEEI